MSDNTVIRIRSSEAKPSVLASRLGMGLLPTVSDGYDVTARSGTHVLVSHVGSADVNTAAAGLADAARAMAQADAEDRERRLALLGPRKGARLRSVTLEQVAEALGVGTEPLEASVVERKLPWRQVDGGWRINAHLAWGMIDLFERATRQVAEGIGNGPDPLLEAIVTAAVPAYAAQTMLRNLLSAYGDGYLEGRRQMLGIVMQGGDGLTEVPAWIVERLAAADGPQVDAWFDAAIRAERGRVAEVFGRGGGGGGDAG